jgi:Helix-turn-helix domain
MVTRATPPNLLLTPCRLEAVMTRLLRRTRAAEMLDVSPRTVRRWGAAGLLEERRLTPHSVRVTEESVLALMAETSGQQNQHREDAAA